MFGNPDVTVFLIFDILLHVSIIDSGSDRVKHGLIKSTDLVSPAEQGLKKKITLSDVWCQINPSLKPRKKMYTGISQQKLTSGFL